MKTLKIQLVATLVLGLFVTHKVFADPPTPAAPLPAIGEWDGVTASAKLRDSYEDPIQSKVPFGIVSYFNQPWRSYMDTWPASHWQYMGGANWNIDIKYADGVGQFLDEEGIRTLRIEVGWGTLNWDDQI